ncbi:MAG: hypothetical protein Q7O12_06325, partial [Deltaproteobacteria bacterium]|nr:hypothetical protein [Deltaproteobacteria bacterium]
MQILTFYGTINYRLQKKIAKLQADNLTKDNEIKAIKKEQPGEPLAKCSGVVREKSPGIANMETSVTCVMNFLKFGHKISVLPEFWAWL